MEANREKSLLQRRWGTLLGALLLFFTLFLWWLPKGLFYLPYIYSESVRRDLSPSLVMSLIYHESKFRIGAISDIGAVGLMQLMPETASEVAQRNDLSLEGNDLFDPKLNITLGILYLDYLLGHYEHDEVTALASYNAGLQNVEYWLQDEGGGSHLKSSSSIPFLETKIYVESILEDRKWLDLILPSLISKEYKDVS